MAHVQNIQVKLAPVEAVFPEHTCIMLDRII
jgi:hypothetical protein